MPESNIDPRQPTKPAPLTPAQNHWLSSITFIIDSMFPLKVECRPPPPVDPSLRLLLVPRRQRQDCLVLAQPQIT